MTIFRSKQKPPPQAGFPQRRQLWIENIGDRELRVMLEPWCTIVEVPPGQWARLEGTFENDRDEYHVQYDPDGYVGVYCPPDTTVEVIVERGNKQ